MPRKRPPRKRRHQQQFNLAGALGGRGRLLIPLSIYFLSFVPAMLWFYQTQPAPATDYKDYVELAAGLVQHQQFGYPEPTARRLPAYPALLALLMGAVRSYYWLAWWNIALTSSIGVLVYYLTRGLTGGNERAAASAGFLCAANPTFIFFGAILASEHLFVPLLVGSLILVGAGRPRPCLRSILAGVLFGCAILTRGEALFYLPLILVLALRSAEGGRRKILLTASFFLACVAVVTPWYIRNVTVIGPGAGLSTVGGVNFYYAHNAREYGYHSLEETVLEPLDEADRNRAGYREGLEYLRENPARLFSDIAHGTKRLYSTGEHYALRAGLYVPEYFSQEGVAFRRAFPWGTRALSDTYYIFLALLGATALVLLVRQPARSWVVPVCIIALNWVCFAVVFWAKARYRFTAEAFLCVLAGIAISRMSDWRWRQEGARRP